MPPPRLSVSWKLAAAVAAAVLLGLAFVLLDQADPEPTRSLDAPRSGALDAEAERLGRSAFATHRPRG